MRPFFYSKKLIPLNPIQLTILNFLILFLEIPPRAITLFFVNLLKILNFLIPK